MTSASRRVDGGRTASFRARSDSAGGAARCSDDGCARSDRVPDRTDVGIHRPVCPREGARGERGDGLVTEARSRSFNCCFRTRLPKVTDAGPHGARKRRPLDPQYLLGADTACLVIGGLVWERETSLGPAHRRRHSARGSSSDAGLPVLYELIPGVIRRFSLPREVPFSRSFRSGDAGSERRRSPPPRRPTCAVGRGSHRLGSCRHSRSSLRDPVGWPASYLCS